MVSVWLLPSPAAALFRGKNVLCRGRAVWISPFCVPVARPRFREQNSARILANLRPGSFVRWCVPTPCLQCGYELEGLSQARCPECDRSFDAGDLALIAERGKLIAASPERRRFLRRAAFGAVTVSTLGVVVLAWPEAERALLGFFLCFAACAGAWFAGFLATRFALGQDRPVLWAIWERSILYISAPWLSIPFFAAALGLISLLENQFNTAFGFRSSDASSRSAILFFLTWGVGSLVVLIVWTLRVSAEIDAKIQIAPARARTWMIAAGLLVFLGALAIGFSGGVFATIQLLDMQTVDLAF